MIIQRSFSTQYGRTNSTFYIFIFILLFAIAIGLNFLGTDFMNSLVNEEVFGKNFNFFHLIPIVIFIFMFFLTKKANKNSKYSHPSIFFMNQEREEFQKKYNQNKILPTLSTGFGLHIILFLIGGVLLFFLPKILNLSIPEEFAQVWKYISIGIVVIAYLFYLKRVTTDYKKYMTEVFEKTSAQLKNTQIIINTKNQDPSPDLPQENSSSLIHGTYKGYEFKLDFHAFNPNSQKNYRYFRIWYGTAVPTYKAQKYSASFKLKQDLKIHFSILEKNEAWEKIEANNLDEAFEERFELKGAKAKDLPDDLKNKLLNYQRNLNLIVKTKEIQFTSESGLFLPYYGAEGTFLFLDFLTEIAHKLENSES